MTKARASSIARIALIAAASLSLAACGDQAADGTSAPAASGDAAPKVAAPAGSSWSQTVKVTPEGGYMMGNPDAPIKLVEFGSVTCGHCAQFEEEAFAEIKSQFVDSGQVSFEFRNFLLNPHDIGISLLTRCNADPAAFFPLTEQFYKNQAVWYEGAQKADPAKLEAASKLPEKDRFLAIATLTGVVDFFKARGISEDQAKACLTDEAKIKALVAMTDAAVKDHKISGTPSFLINGTVYAFQGWPAMKTRLQELGAR